MAIAPATSRTQRAQVLLALLLSQVSPRAALGLVVSGRGNWAGDEPLGASYLRSPRTFLALVVPVATGFLVASWHGMVARGSWKMLRWLLSNRSR